ncbi:uncharacterized protein LOC101856517 [Aplysia californica]|uniref:Uncharacterized protein LOC101856517 n=1 Tax=Aplysia californica TaxID=6500 RepID=A0ABM1A1Z5_APLCA|nr:uncharacterized protein LOC101856517 [Aplysia californica]XP_012939197.1 uncharacterized protein LOC101856517 [Aplysia californica]
MMKPETEDPDLAAIHGEASDETSLISRLVQSADGHDYVVNVVVPEGESDSIESETTLAVGDVQSPHPVNQPEVAAQPVMLVRSVAEAQPVVKEEPSDIEWCGQTDAVETVIETAEEMVKEEPIFPVTWGLNIPTVEQTDPHPVCMVQSRKEKVRQPFKLAVAYKKQRKKSKKAELFTKVRKIYPKVQATFQEDTESISTEDFDCSQPSTESEIKDRIKRKTPLDVSHCLVCSATCFLTKNRKIPTLPLCKKCKKAYFYQMARMMMGKFPKVCSKGGNCRVDFRSPVQCPSCRLMAFQQTIAREQEAHYAQSDVVGTSTSKKARGKRRSSGMSEESGSCSSSSYECIPPTKRAMLILHAATSHPVVKLKRLSEECLESYGVALPDPCDEGKFDCDEDIKLNVYFERPVKSEPFSSTFWGQQTSSDDNQYGSPVKTRTPKTSGSVSINKGCSQKKTDKQTQKRKKTAPRSNGRVARKKASEVVKVYVFGCGHACSVCNSGSAQEWLSQSGYHSASPVVPSLGQGLLQVQEDSSVQGGRRMPYIMKPRPSVLPIHASNPMEEPSAVPNSKAQKPTLVPPSMWSQARQKLPHVSVSMSGDNPKCIDPAPLTQPPHISCSSAASVSLQQQTFKGGVSMVRLPSLGNESTSMMTTYREALQKHLDKASVLPVYKPIPALSVSLGYVGTLDKAAVVSTIPIPPVKALESKPSTSMVTRPAVMKTVSNRFRKSIPHAGQNVTTRTSQADLEHASLCNSHSSASSPLNSPVTLLSPSSVIKPGNNATVMPQLGSGVLQIPSIVNVSNQNISVDNGESSGGKYVPLLTSTGSLVLVPADGNNSPSVVNLTIPAVVGQPVPSTSTAQTEANLTGIRNVSNSVPVTAVASQRTPVPVIGCGTPLKDPGVTFKSAIAKSNPTIASAISNPIVGSKLTCVTPQTSGKNTHPHSENTLDLKKNAAVKILNSEIRVPDALSTSTGPPADHLVSAEPIAIKTNLISSVGSGRVSIDPKVSSESVDRCVPSMTTSFNQQRGDAVSGSTVVSIQPTMALVDSATAQADLTSSGTSMVTASLQAGGGIPSFISVQATTAVDNKTSKVDPNTRGTYIHTVTPQVNPMTSADTASSQLDPAVTSAKCMISNLGKMTRSKVLSAMDHSVQPVTLSEAVTTTSLLTSVPSARPVGCYHSKTPASCATSRDGLSPPQASSSTLAKLAARVASTAHCSSEQMSTS